MKNVIVCIVLVFFTLGCESSTGPAGIKLGEQFQLQYRQSVHLQQTGLTITFRSVHDDSRCPQGVMCFWQGNAGVIVELSGARVPLNTAIEPREAVYSNYTIQLIAVAPLPKAGTNLDPKDYIITLIVTKN